MSTTTTDDPASRGRLEKSEEQIGIDADGGREGRALADGRRLHMGPAAVTILAVIAIWIIARLVWGHQWTLALDPQDTTTIQDNLNTWPDWVAQNQNISPVFIYFVNYIQIALQHVGDFFSAVFYQTTTGLGIPEIGWLGTTVLVTFVAYAIGNIKVAAMTAAIFLFFVLQGLWTDAMASFAQVLGGHLFLLSDRVATRHLGRPERPGQRADHAGPGLHADHAGVRLSGAAGADLLLGVGIRDCRGLHLRGSADHPDHRPRPPRRRNHHQRGGGLARGDRGVSGCAACCCRCPSAPR